MDKIIIRLMDMYMKIGNYSKKQNFMGINYNIFIKKLKCNLG